MHWGHAQKPSVHWLNREGPLAAREVFYHLLQVLSTLEETTLQAGDRWTQPGSLLSYLVQELTECWVGVVFHDTTTHAGCAGAGASLRCRGGPLSLCPHGRLCLNFTPQLRHSHYLHSHDKYI